MGNTGSGSTVMEQRSAEIIQYCLQPRTLKELQSHFHTTYHTIWRAMREPIEAGLIKEIPWRDKREKQFISDVPREGNAVVIVTPAGTRTLGQWATAITGPRDLPAMLNISGALAQLWRYRAFSQSQTEQHLAGSTLPVESKAKLRESLEFLKRLTVAVEQMLLAPVWDDNCDIIEAFGDVDVMQAVELGEQFEKRIGKA